MLYELIICWYSVVQARTLHVLHISTYQLLLYGILFRILSFSRISNAYTKFGNFTTESVVYRLKVTVSMYHVQQLTWPLETHSNKHIEHRVPKLDSSFDKKVLLSLTQIYP